MTATKSSPVDHKARAAVIQRAVSFREVEALVDLPHGQLLSLIDGQEPQLLYDSRATMGSQTPYRHVMPRYTDDQGEILDAGRHYELAPGVYQSVKVDWYTMDRTFVRKQSTPLDNQYVYCYSANDARGSGMTLRYELHFQGGKFRKIDFNSDGNRGQDQRGTDGQPPQTKLVVDELTPAGSRMVSHHWFFVLAPWQLPWPALQAMRGTVAARGVRLHDPFWTQHVQSDGQVLEPADLKPGQAAQLECRIHLVDPFKEALRRNQRFVAALENWQQCQQKMGSDRTYTLAKRIQAVAEPRPELWTHVFNNMWDYLLDAERESIRLLFLADMRAQCLLDWIGRPHDGALRGKRIGDKIVNGDTWVVHKGRMYATKRPFKRKGVHNPFSQACHDYFGATDEVFEDVSSIVCQVHDRLNEIRTGQSWLEQNFKRFAEKQTNVADGGAAILFETVRKGHGSALAGVGFLLQRYGPCWVRKYRSKAASNLATWMKAVHDIDLKQVRPRRLRRAVASVERRRLRKLNQRGTAINHLTLDSPGRSNLAVADSGMRGVSMGIEYINLYLSVQALADSKDPWDVANLMGSLCDTIEATREARAGMQVATVTKYGSLMKGAKASPLAIIGGSIDTVLAARDTARSTNSGMRLGNMMRTMGSMLTVAGAFTAESGVGLLVAIVGLGIQSLGSFIVRNFSDWAIFLRNSKWGDPALTDRIVEMNTTYWLGIPIEYLPENIEAQHRCIDQLIYNFKPELELEDLEAGMFDSVLEMVGIKVNRSVMLGGCLYVKMNPPSVLSPDAKWDVYIDVDRPGTNMARQTFRFRGDEYTSHEDLSQNERLCVKAFAQSNDTSAPVADRAEGRIVVSGRVRLDIQGTGQNWLERTIEKESFRL